MNAIDFIKTKERMCNYFLINFGSNDCCEKCSLSSNNNNQNEINCYEFVIKFPEQAVEIVEKWGKEHPEKTYKSEIIANFPNCNIGNIIRETCPEDFFGSASHVENCYNVYGNTRYSECWSRVVK